jgi:fibronectin-binding autotransporter adhesin
MMRLATGGFSRHESVSNAGSWAWRHNAAVAVLAAVAISCLLPGAGEAVAANVTWETTSGDWGSTANWGGSLPGSGDIAIFGAENGDVLITVGGTSTPREVAGLLFDKTGTTAFVGGEGSGGGLLRIGADGIFMPSTTGPVVIGQGGAGGGNVDNRVRVELTADQTWTNNVAATQSTPVTLLRDGGDPPGGIVLNEYTLTIAGSGVTELRGPIDGSGGIIKTGAGTLQLANNKTFAGGIVLDQGALGLLNGAVLGPGVLTINGGQIFSELTDRSVSNDMVWNADVLMRHPQVSLSADLAYSLTITGSTLLTGNRTVTVNNGSRDGSPTFFAVGPIGDGGNAYTLTKSGPGALVFIGDNTYTGVTTVSQGALQVGAASGGGADSGSLSGDVVLNGASTSLVFDRNGSLGYGGGISGSGSVVKNGIGGLTLTGTNTYTGTLTVNTGALGIDSVAALPGWDQPGRYSVSANASITFGSGVSSGQIATILSGTLGNVDPNAGTGFDTSGGNLTFSDNLADAFGARNVAKTGPNSLILDGQSTNTTTLTIAGGNVQAASGEIVGTSGPLGQGQVVFAGGTLQYSAANQFDYSPRFTNTAGQVYAVDTAGQNVTWARTFSLGENSGISKSGAGTLTLGDTLTMASSGLAVSEGTLVVPSVVLTAETGALFDVTAGGRLEVGALDRDTGGRPLLITGNGEVVFTDTIANLGNNGPMTLAGGVTVFFPAGNGNASNGQLTIADGIAIGDRLRDATQNSSFGNPGSAARGIIRMGSGETSATLRLTVGGDTSNRRIRIGSGAAASDTGGAIIEQNGTAAQVFNNAAFNEPVSSVTAPRTLTLGGTNVDANTISGVIANNSAQGTVSVVKTGPGRWVLSGANTYTGTTTVSQGILGIASTGALPGWNVTGRYSVASGAVLTVANAVTDANVTTMLATGNFAAGAAIGFDTTAANRTFAGNVTGNLGLVKLGGNTLTLTGENAPEAGTTISGGAIQVGSGGTVGSLAGDVNVLASSSLAFNRSDDITLTNAISGGGVISQAGTGRLTLSTASPSFSGVLQAPAGTVRVTNGGALGSAVISPGGGTAAGTVELEGGISLPNPLTISARNSATSTNIVSVRNVAGTNEITGNVTISPGGNVYELASDAGLLRLSGNWGAAGSAADTARTIPLTGNGDFDIAGTIPVQGTTRINFTKSGAGTVFFSGTRDMVGDTTVNAGRMFMNPGSVFTNRAGIVTIASGATLAGSGTIANLVRINGIHAPGGSPGVQTFTNDLVYEATGSLVWELSGNTADAADRGTDYDGVDVTGVGGKLFIDPAATLSLVFDAPFANNDPSTVDFTNPFWGEDRLWQVIALTEGAMWDDAPTAFGTILVGEDAFGNILAEVRPQASFSLLAQSDGVFLVYTAVPEPSAFVLGLAGVAFVGVLSRARRRRG